MNPSNATASMTLSAGSVMPFADQRMLELLMRVLLELRGDVHILGAFQHLRVNHVSDDRLIFAR
jgi:hypothetical protein